MISHVGHNCYTSSNFIESCLATCKVSYNRIFLFLCMQLSHGNHEQIKKTVSAESIQYSNSKISDIHLNPGSIHEIGQILGTTVSHEWMNIGVLVGVPMEKLKKIQHDFHTVDVFLQEMLSSYFKYGLSNTWGTLLSTVKLFNAIAAKELVVLCQKLNPALEQYNCNLLLQEVKYHTEVHGGCKFNIQNIFWSLIQYASKWYRIGKCLKVPPERLETISQDFSNCRDRLREIIHVVYAEMDAKYTWFSLANALEMIHTEVAAKLRANGIVGKLFMSQLSFICNSGE